jgi:glycerol-3-phosphate O-acyltransferase
MGAPDVEVSPSPGVVARPVEPGWPESRGERVLFLLDASSPLEKRLLEDWVARHRPTNGASVGYDLVPIPPSRRRPRRDAPSNGRLEACLAAGDDPLLAPLRVAWERDLRPDRRENPLRELLTVGDPRDPGRLRQEWVLRRHPERCRIVAGEPAHASELRDRWRQLGGVDVTHTTGLAEFVARQATLALERAERRLRGQRYKVPKLVREDILSRPAFRAGIVRLARELGRDEEKVATEAAADLREIAATHNPFVIELTSHLIHQIYKQGYEGLSYDRARLEEIYTRTQRHPVVFLPSHKSNLDHLVLQYALHENGLPPNHTAGGINMNFFPVGPLMRRSGVFFIRRSFKDDPVYKFVIRQYIDYLIEKRFSLEWYVEGGRSRSGKLLPPRLGLLAYVVDAYRRGKSEDVWLIPVSIAYDQIGDVGDYVAEQRGAKKTRESFGWFLRMIRSLRRRFGRIYIDFGEPLSLREQLGPPDATAEPNPDEESIQLQKVAFEVAVRIDRVTPITPTSLLTLALLGTGDRALTLEETRTALAPLVAYVAARSLPVTGKLDLDTTAGVERALGALVENGVVSCFAEGPDAVYAIGEDQHLAAAYYRNTIIHFFVNGAIAELALLCAADEPAEGDPAARFWEEAMRLRDLLKFEFFFAEKEQFRAEVAAELTARDPQWQSAVQSGGDAIRALVRRLKPLLAHRVLRPFLEAYQVVGDSLSRVSDAPFDEGRFLAQCTARASQYVRQRRIRRRESVSAVLFQTALRLARNRRLVESGPDVEARRQAFAEEIRAAIRGIDAIDALAAGRRAGLLD